MHFESDVRTVSGHLRIEDAQTGQHTADVDFVSGIQEDLCILEASVQFLQGIGQDFLQKSARRHSLEVRRRGHREVVFGGDLPQSIRKYGVRPTGQRETPFRLQISM